LTNQESGGRTFGEHGVDHVLASYEFLQGDSFEDFNRPLARPAETATDSGNGLNVAILADTLCTLFAKARAGARDIGQNECLSA